MIEVIVTVHLPTGPVSVSVKVEDEKAAAKLLRGDELGDLGKRMAKLLVTA
jgi:hypothetical protein